MVEVTLTTRLIEWYRTLPGRSLPTWNEPITLVGYASQRRVVEQPSQP
jgi:hypothetical protein